MNQNFNNLNNVTNQNSNNGSLNNQPLNNNQNINSTYSQSQSNMNMSNQINNNVQQQISNNTNLFNQSNTSQTQSNYQTNMQQYSNIQQQNYPNKNLNQQNMNQNNSYQQPVQQDYNNQSLNTNPKKKNKVGIIIIVIIALLLILGVIILINKNKAQSTTNNPNSEKNTNSSTNTSYDGKYVIYLNNMKITLGETTMDYIVQNTDLEVIRDYTSHSSVCSSCEAVNGLREGDTREITLSDGKNTFSIKSFFGYPNKTKSIGNDGSSFNTSTGTKIVFVDNTLGREMKIGDVFTRQELYDFNELDKVWGSETDFSVSQTKYLSNDAFHYYLENIEENANRSEDKFQIIRIWATLNLMG